jgi:hypothetical protein
MGLPEQKIYGFTTEQGSTYNMNGSSTQRTKTAHMFHDPKDVGLKPSSHTTVYLHPDHAAKVGMWNTLNAHGKRAVIRGNEVLLTSLNPKTGVRGLDERFPFHAEPAVGTHPLELFEPSSSVKGGFRGNHPGNKITQLHPTPSPPLTKKNDPEDLIAKIEELRKGLLSIKPKQDFFVPAIKSPELKTPKMSMKQPSAMPGTLPPPSKKDPKKMAEQLKNPNPGKVQAPEILKIENNGQWKLV